jgi:hypothetical protein
MTRATITVQASAEHQSIFDIRDAMQQVLDFFEFLSSEDDKNVFVWNLTYAATNSPFTATAEAISLNKDVDIRAVANSRVLEASEHMFELTHGRLPSRPINNRRAKYAQNILRRNTAQIGKTTINFDLPTAKELILTPSSSALAIKTYTESEILSAGYLRDNRQRTEIGSIEGTLERIGTDYNNPAVFICERKSGDNIACRVDEDVISEITRTTNIKDVWERKRVKIRGKIEFNANGKIVRVHARSITIVHPRNMTLHDIEDRDLTGNDTIITYLNKLREG